MKVSGTGAILVNLREMGQAEDRKQAILDKMGNLDGLDVIGSLVLVATMPDRTKSKGGILYSDKAIEEARWQGKVGLVLKLGQTAFKYSGAGQHYPFEGRAPKIGEWIEYRPATTDEVGIRGISCRYVDSIFVRAILDNPDNLDIW